MKEDSRSCLLCSLRTYVCTGLRAQLNSLQKALKELERDLDKAKETIRIRDEEIVEAKETITLLRNRLSDAKKQIEELEAEIERYIGGHCACCILVVCL